MSLNGTLEWVGEELRLMGESSPDPDRERVKELVAELLNIVPRGTYGTKLFNALARLTVTPAAEACCFRYHPERGYEVLLRQRGPNEAYPGQFHCPGSVYRPGETDADLFGRLERSESMVSIRNPRLVGHHNHQTEDRGHFMALIFLVDAEEGLGTKWYSVEDLPEPMVEHHRTTVIPIALAAFMRERSVGACWGSL